MINQKPNQPNPFLCLDCGIDTYDTRNYYMLKDEVWELTKVTKGMLCVKCCEARIGRELNKSDFTDCECNFMLNQCDLLKQRINNA